MFASNECKFNTSIKSDSGVNNDEVKPPTLEKIRIFWSSIWRTSVQHKPSKWFSNEKTERTRICTMFSWEISLEKVRYAVNKTLNWNAPCLESLENFCFKQFVSTHIRLVESFTSILEHLDLVFYFYDQWSHLPFFEDITIYGKSIEIQAFSQCTNFLPR